MHAVTTQADLWDFCLPVLQHYTDYKMLRPLKIYRNLRCQLLVTTCRGAFSKKCAFSPAYKTAVLSKTVAG